MVLTGQTTADAGGANQSLPRFKNRDQDFRGDRPRRMADAERVTLTRAVLVGHPDTV